MARLISFDINGEIEVDKPKKAIVRFPTESEQALGMTEVPKETRLDEYANQG